LKNQRINLPLYFSDGKSNLPTVISWYKVLNFIENLNFNYINKTYNILTSKASDSQVLRQNTLDICIGKFTDLETILLSRTILEVLGSGTIFHTDYLLFKNPFKYQYTFNSNFKNIELSDVLLLLVTNLRSRITCIKYTYKKKCRVRTIKCFLFWFLDEY